MKKVICIIISIVLFSSFAFADETAGNYIGCFSVPCLNIDMPLYAPTNNNIEHWQEIIDAENSALYIRWNTAYQILDHLFSNDADGKGEWNIQKVFPGAYAYLYTDTASYYYECYLTGKTEYDGNEYICNKLVIPASSKDILIACCAEDSEHHFIAVFKQLREMK